MTERENILAILRYQPYERMPVVSFGYWPETLRKWAEEGHISAGEAEGYARCGDNSEADFAIMRRLGFDFQLERLRRRQCRAPPSLPGNRP